MPPKHKVGRSNRPGRATSNRFKDCVNTLLFVPISISSQRLNATANASFSGSNENFLDVDEGLDKASTVQIRGDL